LWSKINFLKFDHKMKPTQFFREQLGLTQEMMAMYLAATKSQLSKYELDKRELPSAA
jgi:transcriptional regulator with XRE-family HTH domain